MGTRSVSLASPAYKGSRGETRAQRLDISTYVSKQGRAHKLDLAYISHRECECTKENKIREREKEEGEVEAIMQRETNLRAEHGGAGGGRCVSLWYCLCVCTLYVRMPALPPW